jgi:hypothetical protein
VVQEAELSDFNDLGKMMLAGFIAAIGLALIFTFLRLRLRDKKPQPAYISIKPPESH